MRPLPDLPLERKLAIVVLATCTIALVLACVALGTFELFEFRKTLVRDVTVLADIAGRNTHAALRFRVPTTAEDTLRALDAEPQIVSARLYDEDGNLFAEHKRQGVPASRLVELAGDGHRYVDGFLVVAHPVLLDGRRIGTIQLRASEARLHERLRTFAVIAVGVLIASLALAGALSQRLQRTVTGAILALATTARTIAERNDFSLRAIKEGDDEVGELSDEFNAMLDRIEERERALRAEISERERAEGRTRSQLARLQLLNEITRAIGERQDLLSVNQVVLSTLENDLPVDFACMLDYADASGLLTVSAVGSLAAAPAGRIGLIQGAEAIDAKASGLSRCVQGELIYEPNLRALSAPLLRQMLEEGFNSLVMSPLVVESKVFGLLLAARRQPDAFSSGECEFIRQLSEHVALAAHHVRLYEALETAYNDLHQTQQAIMQQERLRALGEMASGIAHDINNAISPVALYTESLLEQEPNLSAKTRDYLITIQHAAEDVANTVSRMREFYRHREPQAAFTPLSLGKLVDQVVDLTRARWSNIPQQRGVVIELRKDLAIDLPKFMGAESEIREALTNLIFNAVDAMPDGGTLTLRTVHACPGPGNGDASGIERVAVEVVDSGIGMDEATRERCIEPFYTTKGERGTGLGMAMVYGTAQRHGAELEVESEVGRGTTVRLLFEVAQPDENVVGPAVEARRPAKRLRLLVVDDDPLLIKSLRDILKSDGHDVTVANGGGEGIEKFRSVCTSERPFAAVITDLGMPNVDGRKVAEAVKSMSSTPVIMLTGWGQRLVAEGDIPPHVDRVLNKPPRLQDLRNALAALCTDAGG
jgi:signal transduction histidine kinase/ActR/RegA family two-component response regulator/HAMP domain-containing protein